MVTFSVLTPAYQSARFVGQAVSTALGQTVPPHEVIVVDDGSTDELDAALSPFVDRIQLVRQANAGPGAARNTALGRATGDWVVLLDADDYWAPTRLERIADHIASDPGCSIVATDATIVDSAGSPRGRWYRDKYRFPGPDDDQRTAILRESFVFPGAAARRDRLSELGGFDEEMRGPDDWDMWVRIILAGGRAALVDEPLAFYRVHGDNISNRSRSMWAGCRMVYAKALASGLLTGEERRIAERGLAKADTVLAAAEAYDAVVDGRPEARSLALAMVRSPERLASRLRWLLTAIAPKLSRRFVVARREL